MKYTTLDNIVRDICAVQLEDPANKQYLRVARAVKAGIDVVHMTYLPAIQTKLLDVADNLTVQLPPDLVSVIKVGLLTDDGKIVSLIQDPQLRRVEYNNFVSDGPLYCECEVPPPSATVVPDAAEPSDIFHNCWWWNFFYGELYAAGNGMDHEGGWRYNSEYNVLEMATGTLVQAGVKVLVEYKSMGDEGYTMIPAVASETIQQYALYKLFQNIPGKANYHMQEFRRLGRELKIWQQPFDTLGVVNAFMRGQKGTVK